MAVELIIALGTVCKANWLGIVFRQESGYQNIFPAESKRVRKPDVSFIRVSRLPQGGVPKGYLNIAPDLSVEVISPNDLAQDVQQKSLTALPRASN